MKRTIMMLGAIAVVVAGLAVLAAQRRESLTAAGTPVTGTLFPALEGHVNDVAEIQVTGSDGSFVLKREGETWGAAGKGGYPVDFGKVKSLVVAISNFDLIEAKTANPAHHEKLGLEEPGTPESESTRVTLKDAAGTVLADVIVGDARASRGGDPSLYARRAGEDQAYEVAGRLYVDTNPSSWLDPKILELEQERIASVAITHPDGERLLISREGPEQADFTVADLPEGRELLWAGVARSVANAAQSLSLEDVGGADLVDFESLPATVAEFRTFDGLVVTATTAKQDEKTYLRVAARAEEIAGPEPAAVEASSSEQGTAAESPAEPAGGEAGDADAAAGEQGEAETPAEGSAETADAEAEEDAEPPRKSFEEVAAEAERINAKVGAWTYVIPSWTATNLRKRQSELLKPLEPEGPPTPAVEELTDEEPAPPAEAEAEVEATEAEDESAAEEPAPAGTESEPEPAPETPGSGG